MKKEYAVCSHLYFLKGEYNMKTIFYRIYETFNCRYLWEESLRM